MSAHPVKDRMTTIGEGGRRFWLYPASFEGVWLRRRQLVAAVLILIFFVLPWTKINGQQTVLLDVVNRKFAIFGVVFWPQDLLIFWFFLVGSVIAIFLITAQWGRLWCGWACPQTVFLEHVFRKVETWIEGDGLTRRRRDLGPLTLDKLWRKTAKFALFAVISTHFANTVLCYFVGTDRVIYMTFHAPATHWGWFTFMGLLNLLFFLNFAWFREQFCLIACPYGRFQSVLLDSESLLVGYDYSRGEPRGVMRKKEARQKGDCIDCNRCVAVCPTGIDIRMGLQMECINCTACMDACDQVMEKVNLPKGLIRYTAIANLEGRARRFFRPRTVIYMVLVTFLWTVGTVLLFNRGEVVIQVVRPKGASFSLTEKQDTVMNLFQAQASNKTDHPLELTASVPAGYELVAALNPWVVPPQQTMQNQLFVRKAAHAFSRSGKERLVIEFYQKGHLIREAEVTLMGPEQ